MQSTNVLNIQRISAEDRAKIEAVDPAIQLTDAGGWYDQRARRLVCAGHLILMVRTDRGENFAPAIMVMTSPIVPLTAVAAWVSEKSSTHGEMAVKIPTISVATLPVLRWRTQN